MSAPPKVFISATTGDLRSVRQLIKEALLTINCHPVEQTNFEPDARTVEGMLRGKIADCTALIHIAGLRYGAEPDPDTLPPGTPRRSYTQMEYHLGRQLQAERGDDHFRVYTFLCPESFPFDPEPDTESGDLSVLQQAHRQAILDDPHLREKPRNKDELQARILALQEQVFALLREQAEVKAEVIKSHRFSVKAFAVLSLLLALVLGGIYQVWKGQTVDTAHIRVHLLEASDRQLKVDLENADKELKSTDRQRLREAAEAAHKGRLAGMDEFATSFTELEGNTDTSHDMHEMIRILNEEGVDRALSYAETLRQHLLEGVAASAQAQHDKARQKLQPLLKVAQLQQSSGHYIAARTGYRQILALEPDWPEALEGYESVQIVIGIMNVFEKAAKSLRERK